MFLAPVLLGWLAVRYTQTYFLRPEGSAGAVAWLVQAVTVAAATTYVVNRAASRLAPLSTMLKGNPGRQRLSVLRIQPPLTITPQEIDRFIEALGEALAIIASNNEYCLVGHLSGHRVPAAERRAWLAKRCAGSDTVRAEVEALLDAHMGTGLLDADAGRSGSRGNARSVTFN